MTENYELETKKQFNLRLEAKLKNGILVKARESLSLTAKKAAEIINVPYNTYLKYESMKSYPTDERQNKICDFYGLSKERVFPKELFYFNSKKYIAERVIPAVSLISLSQTNKKFLPVYNMAEEVEREILIKEMIGFLDKLEPRQRRVIELRFGLNGNRLHTLKEVAERIRLSRQRASDIEKSALEELKEFVG